MLVFAVAQATLLFGTAFPDRVSTGLVMALTGSVVSVGVVAALSGLRGAVACTQEVSLVMLAAMIADLRASYPAGTDPEVVFPTALAAVLLTGLAIGAGCHLAARARLARFVHLLPWPVVAGVLSGSGAALALTALPVLTGTDSLAAVASDGNAARHGAAVGLGIAVAAALVLAARHRASHATLIATLVLGYCAWRIVAHLSGMELAALRADGWTMSDAIGAQASTAAPWEGLLPIDWWRVAGRLPFIGAVVVVVIVAMLVHAGATAEVLGRDIDEARELRALGTASLVGGCAFGLVGYHAPALAQVGLRMRAAGRAIGLLAAVILLAALPFTDAVLSHAPRFLVGGMLLWIGADLVFTWMLAPRASLSRVELAIVVAIALTIAVHGFLPGLFAGLCCSFALFALDYGRAEARRELVEGREAVRAEPGAPLVFRPSGYLYFGTARRLVDRVEERLAAHGTDPRGPPRVVLDFERVTGLDASAMRALEYLYRLTRRRGIALLVSSFPADRLAALYLIEARTRPGAIDRAPVFDSLAQALAHPEDPGVGAPGTAEPAAADVRAGDRSASASPAPGGAGRRTEHER